MSNFGQMLGLPARQIPAYVPIPGAPSSGTSAPNSSGGSAASAFLPQPASNPTDPTAIQQALAQAYKSLGTSPTGRGTGPTDIAYYADQIASTGGLTPQNISYWFGPTGRIANDLGKSGGSTSGVATPNSFASYLPREVYQPGA